MTKALVYCRVSTDNQEREGTSLQTQEEACLKYCESKGYIVGQVFKETYSGANMNRPELDKLRDTIETTSVNAVVIYCLDRLSRDPIHIVLLSQRFDELGITLEAVSENIENTETGRLINYIKGYTSKIELEKIKDRTSRGKKALLKQGRICQGTGKGIYGYDWNKETKARTINERESKVVQYIFSAVVDGASLCKITADLNGRNIPSKAKSIWHPLTIRRVIKNETYTGKTYYGKTKRVNRTKVENTPREQWILLPDATPPLISEEMFEKAQLALDIAKNNRTVQANNKFMLTGFIRCGMCGTPVNGHTLGKKYRYYQCRGAMPASNRGKICNAKQIRADYLEEQFINEYEKLATNPLVYLSLCLQMNFYSKRPLNAKLSKKEQLSNLENKQRRLSKKENELLAFFRADTISKDALQKQLRQIKQDKEQITSDIEYLKAKADNEEGYLMFNGTFSELTKQAVMCPEQYYPDYYAISIEDKLKFNREQFDLLGINSTVTPENLEVNAYVDPQLLADFDCLNDRSHFYELLQEFETRHPEVQAIDLFDYSAHLPEDTTFGIILNNFKRNRESKLYHQETNIGIITCK